MQDWELFVCPEVGLMFGAFFGVMAGLADEEGMFGH